MDRDRLHTLPTEKEPLLPCATSRSSQAEDRDAVRRDRTVRCVHHGVHGSDHRSLARKALPYLLVFLIVAWGHNAFGPIIGLRATPVERILRAHPLIDGHNDLLILIRAIYGNHIHHSNFTKPLEEGGMVGHFDFPRAEEGLLGGTFWSAWVPCPADGFDFSNENYAPYVRSTLEQIDLYNRLSEKYPTYFTLSRNAEEAKEHFRSDTLISPLAIEGLHQIGNSLSTLRLYHKLGVKYATLTWNCHNNYADAAMVSIDGETVASKPYHGGVSMAGRDLILEMNRLGKLATVRDFRVLVNR